MVDQGVDRTLGRCITGVGVVRQQLVGGLECRDARPGQRRGHDIEPGRVETVVGGHADSLWPGGERLRVTHSPVGVTPAMAAMTPTARPDGCDQHRPPRTPHSHGDRLGDGAQRRASRHSWIRISVMSASLEQSRSQVIHSAAELADEAGGETLEPFLRHYYRHVATEDLVARRPEDLVGAALSHKATAAHRPVGTANVNVFTPTVEEQGWSCDHTVIQIVTDDMPFIVDSVTVELARQERVVHLVIHPQLVVRRDAAGELEDILGVDAMTESEFGAGVESWIHVEIDRQGGDAEREALAQGLRRVLSDVRESVEDWPKMISRSSASANTSSSARTTRMCCARSPARAWASCVTTSRSRAASVG